MVPPPSTATTGVTAYGRFKLAQAVASFDLAADLAGTGVSVNAVHPATFMDTAMVRESEHTPPICDPTLHFIAYTPLYTSPL
jgi:NAD(P)-dependent dehydrogenase (short-subunit alcohol dehydrogenase family)